MLIAEDKDIKQSLYPPCGPNASSSNGGGKPKIDTQWELANLLLGDDEKYKESLKAAAVVPKDKNGMATIAREYNKEMGETGAGIRDAASIDMSKNNTFTTKWAEISAKCPWYFEMRDLIGQRPNLVPTGLGHSASAVTNDVLMPANPFSGDELEEEEEEDDDNHTSSVRPNDAIHSPRSTPEPITGKRTFFEIDDAAKSDLRR
ncbi:hypothetical protein B0H14DRAFT_3786596 [Mycena olivaceomarginata]|nr:hypothetical protein B0H14DRAFT_3786596 [Mycena olivaceomarginata]